MPIHVDVTESLEPVFAVVAPLPKIGAKDLALLRIGLNALKTGSVEYSPGTIRQVTDGREIHCKLLADTAIVSFTCAPGQAAAGADMMASLIREPSLGQEDLDAALKAIKVQTPSYWSIAMDATYPEADSCGHDDVLKVFQRVFRPDHISMAYGGDLGKADVPGEWLARTEDWKPTPDPILPDDSKMPNRSANSEAVATIVVVGPEVRTTDASLAPNLLALYALGSGKGSSLFRISRERHAWSYRQEAYLWPTRAGWEPRLFVAMAPTAAANQRAEVLRQELDQDVDSWSEDERARALGMAEGTLLRGLPYGPLLLGDEPIGGSGEDQVAMAAYWQAKTGHPWDPQQLYLALSHVSLDDLKSAAHRVLSGSKVNVLLPDRR